MICGICHQPVLSHHPSAPTRDGGVIHQHCGDRIGRQRFFNRTIVAALQVVVLVALACTARSWVIVPVLAGTFFHVVAYRSLWQTWATRWSFWWATTK